MNFEELINQTPRERIWNLFERLESESGLAKILKRSDTELTNPENIEALESFTNPLIPKYQQRNFEVWRCFERLC